MTSQIEEARLFKVFLLIVNPRDTNFRSLFKFGLETDQFFDKTRPRVSDYEELYQGRILDWVKTSGIAWIIVSELNVALAKMRRHTSISFTYLFGRDSLA